MIDSVKLSWLFDRLSKGQGGALLELADRIEELHPGECTASKPAIYPDHALDKVRSLAPWRTWEIENALIGGHEITHAPTLAYEFSNVGISGAHLYKGSSRAVYGAGKNPFFGKGGGPFQDIDTAQLVTCRVGSEHFGHFLWDNLPMELLPSSEGNPITLSALPRWHEDSYRQLFDLPAPPCVNRGYVKKLTVYSDVGQNTYRAERYEALRARARRTLAQSDTPRDNPGVFIMRGGGGERRKMVNEQAVAEFMRSIGFTVINPDKMSGEDIAEASLDARVVVGVEGSHIAHILYTIADQGSFLMLQPPDRFSMVYKEFTDRMDMSFAFLVGDTVEEGFRIEIEEIERLLARLL